MQKQVLQYQISAQKKEENLKTLEAERAEIEEEGHYHLLRRL